MPKHKKVDSIGKLIEEYNATHPLDVESEDDFLLDEPRDTVYEDSSIMRSQAVAALCSAMASDFMSQYEQRRILRMFQEELETLLQSVIGEARLDAMGKNNAIGKAAKRIRSHHSCETPEFRNKEL